LGEFRRHPKVLVIARDKSKHCNFESAAKLTVVVRFDFANFDEVSF